MTQETTTILLADDSRFFLTIEKQFLAKTPATIIEAKSAAEALVLCRERRPSLIYLSADLPDGGTACCRQIKDDPKLRSIPVILVFSEPSAACSEEVKGTGCDAVLTKPLDRHQFLEIGRSFLAGIRERRRPCLITLRAKSQQEAFTGRGLDLSSGGVFFQANREIPIGTELQLELHLAHGDATGPWANCTGIVVWRNTAEQPRRPNHPPGYGIKFTDLPMQALGILHGFLRSLDREPRPARSAVFTSA